MENCTILYFDGSSARPSQVRVLLFNGRIHIHDGEDDHFLQSFPLKGSSYNQVGFTHYVYLDTKGLQYLEFTGEHPLAEGIAKQISNANPSLVQDLMRQKTVILVTLFILLGVGLYFFIITLIPFIGTKVIGVQEEIRIGNQLREMTITQEATFGVTIDTAGTHQLQNFADHLKLSKRYPIRVTLLKRNEVNAYALPGGQIVVYSGILNKIKTPEALAALLAHESTHVNEQHSLKSLLRSAANGIIISVIFSDATGISGALVSNVENLNGLRYSRMLETEADEKGMELLLKNEVSVDGMRQLMKTTLQKIEDIPSSLSFLSSHPLTKERIRNAELFIKKHPQRPTTREDLKIIFQELK
ncbi:M48 family metallopeptidase [Chitinophagaceae bacterium LB-8]|uniref:M48 family metallopeptidase n=1 Tax=Paraflavisolibacter caeni TaxID=2982496 RepID=A0A9X2XSL7_9BACT|nr:M48 family metallopeptidase [Paraflavisolibacter caeni]MCU7547690.1 M48 family metallopeptidase [Paraflavisolibacter caeni]